MSVCYVNICWFVWMLIGSEITRNYRNLPVAKLSQSRDFFFDLATVSGVFGKYAKKSKLVVWLV